MTSAFGGQHSIQLSYGCLGLSLAEARGGFNAKGKNFRPAIRENARLCRAPVALPTFEQIPGQGWTGRMSAPARFLP